jgi:hypothetical protein
MATHTHTLKHFVFEWRFGLFEIFASVSRLWIFFRLTSSLLPLKDCDRPLCLWSYS